MSSFELFDRVTLLRDLPERGLRQGDVGAIVEFWTPEAAIVEFFESSGETKAVTTVCANDLRRVRSKETLSPR
jgi:hypothetical protein